MTMKKLVVLWTFEGRKGGGTAMRQAILPLLFLVLIGCSTPRFQPAMNLADTEMARAERDYQQQFRQFLNQQMAVNEYGGLAALGNGLS